MTEQDLTLRVVDRSVPADGVVVLDLVAADGGELPAWAPGAHLDLRCGELVRQYSLCGDPSDRSRYRVAVRREEPGRGGSRFLHEQVSVGNSLGARGPRNHFPLVDATAYVFIAGGIGITPILPMLARADAAGIYWRLAYGGRTHSSMPFADDLLTRHPDRVTLHPQDETGLLDLDALLADLEPDTAIYCCGPEALLQAVERRTSAHVERFAPRELGPTENRPFTITLAGSGRLLDVPADRSALDVLVDAGVPVLSSCTEGTCGTCETAVLEGEVDHRDSVLSPEERAAQDCMFVCVSRAAGTTLVLDL
jgi:ferredoxin-NADP reductase